MPNPNQPTSTDAPQKALSTVPCSARQWWKRTYRLQRVVRREAKKAQMDMLIYGTSVVKIEGGEPSRQDPTNYFKQND